jgi:hypothetical protein
VLCHGDGFRLVLVTSPGAVEYSHVEEVQTLSLGLDLPPGQFQRGNHGTAESNLLIFGHPHRVTTLELNQPQLVQVKVKSGVIHEILRRELELDLTATIRALSREGNCESEASEGETGEDSLHCGRGGGGG